MKKFLAFATLASVALVGCVNDEKMEMTSGAQKISFDAPVFNTQTRAVDGEINNAAVYPTDETFKVYAIQHEAGKFATNGWVNATGNMAFWSGALDVSYAGNEWSTATAYYWPNTAYNLSFAAYSPARLTGVSYGETGLTVTDFTVANSLPHIDLMYSGRQTEKNQANSAEGVPVTFKHALSSVVFSATDNNDNANYTIKSIKLTGTLVNKGTFNEGLTNTTTSGTATWTPATATTVEYAVLATSKDVNTDKSKTVITAGETAMLPIPQTDLSTAKVIVSFTVDPTSGDDYDVEATIDLSAFKKDDNTSISSWVMNNRYEYVINFGASEKITFKPTVDTWDDGGVATYTIK